MPATSNTIYESTYYVLKGDDDMDLKSYFGINDFSDDFSCNLSKSKRLLQQLEAIKECCEDDCNCDLCGEFMEIYDDLVEFISDCD